MPLRLVLLALFYLTACSPMPRHDAAPVAADRILVNASVYTLSWAAPSVDGTPSPAAPVRQGHWTPDAQAIAIADGRIVYAGSVEAAMRHRTDGTNIIDLGGATVLPGLHDSHTHVFALGEKLTQVDLTDAVDEDDAIARVVARARVTPAGEWILGGGWDEGAWADRYPDKRKLSAAVPDHPVVLRSLHGFALWANQAALRAAGITAQTKVPVGGERRLAADGTPSGLFLNRATTMFNRAIPAPTEAQLMAQALAGLNRMAEDGFVTVHDAGLNSAQMAALERLEAEGRLPIRVYAMLSLRDEPLIERWLRRGPVRDTERRLVTRTVKAYYDGALGSRGARLLDDYSDKPGHRGVSGDNYGFNEALNERAMRAGFQVAIHAIGDAGNREALDIIERNYRSAPESARLRHRIEHAQVLHPDDIPRLQALGIIASMEPPHAMEDKAWAEQRLGPARIRGAYAWRSLRMSGARITFNSDNPGSDHNIFYGLHSAVTRQDKNLEPPGGWFPEQRMTAEEALRAYTIGAAYASFREDRTGVIAPGRWADLTVIDIDPLNTAATRPNDLLNGRVLMTVVDGEVVSRRSPPGVAGSLNRER
ncbi:MAG: amidohydrolase [Pseudomonadota bacterium]